VSTLETHLSDLRRALDGIDHELPRIRRWGEQLAARLLAGGRLLACGNGGSAAQAQHLTAELVGRYHEERRPFSAIALHAETSALTAIVNDYGPDEAFARQVRAHGRRGDVLVALSTSGHSSNVLAAAGAAAELGITVLALTGSAPNPLAAAAHDAVCIPGPTPTVQELHLLAIHLLCEAVDEIVLAGERAASAVIDLDGAKGIR
jgi:D-sedoheptulose 7-phosphate isomerase